MGHMAMLEYPAGPGYTTDLAEIPNAVIEEQRMLTQRLAAEYHAGQMYDEVCGISFFDGHLAPVVEIGELLCRMTGHSRIIVPALWTHDGPEDKLVTLESMEARGVIRPVTRIVDVMTRWPGTGYLPYMRKVADDDDGRHAKLADSLGNLRVNLDFHEHDSPGRVQKRLLRYPKNVAILAPRVFGEDDVTSPGPTSEMLQAPPSREAALEQLVGHLVQLRRVLAFDGTFTYDEIRQQLLAHPRQVAFLAPIVLDRVVDPGLVNEIRQGVLSASEMV